MKFANDWDIAQYRRAFDDPALANLDALATTLANLAEWTDRNSDGWCYWPKPVRAALRTIETLEVAYTGWRSGFLSDITETDAKRAIQPIKSFLTKQGVTHAEVIESSLLPVGKREEADDE